MVVPSGYPDVALTTRKKALDPVPPDRPATHYDASANSISAGRAYESLKPPLGNPLFDDTP